MFMAAFEVKSPMKILLSEFGGTDDIFIDSGFFQFIAWVSDLAIDSIPELLTMILEAQVRCNRRCMQPKTASLRK